MAHEFGSNLLMNFNLVFEREIGSGASSETEVEYQWDLRWRGNPQFEPAIQMYGKFGTLDDLGLDNRQHIGPGRNRSACRGASRISSPGWNVGRRSMGLLRCRRGPCMRA